MYIVAKPMRYGGKDYQRGDIWEPSGHRNDPAIIKARMVLDADVHPRLQRGDSAGPRRRKVPPHE